MGRKLASHFIAATALAALFAGIAQAETPQSAEIERLRAQIEQRDAVITQLLQRVEALERHLRRPADGRLRPARGDVHRRGLGDPRARTLLDVAGDIGITEDAPDYTVRLGLTHRFDMPWR